MIKKILLIFFLFFIFHFSFFTFVHAQPQSCSADKPYEIIPSCAVCGEVLFCYGNNYRLCETDPRIPAPALGKRNGSWYYDSTSFSDGTIIYNGITFSVPPGGVYVCDSNVYGCANKNCKGQIRINTSPSLVCGKTTYTASKTTEEPVATPTPTEGEGEVSVLGLFDLSGEVKLPKAEFPDYSLFERVAHRALPALLPAYWQNSSDNPGSLNIPQGTLPIKIKHRVEGQSQEDKQDPHKTVTESETPSAFVPFLAENFALSAVLNPKSGPTQSLNYALPNVEPGIPDEKGECQSGGETLDENLSKLDNPNPGFIAKGILEKIEEIIGGIIRKIFRAEVKVESRGNLYGGEELIEKSDAAATFVPKQFLPDKNASSYQEGRYRISTSFFGTEEKTETLRYQGQKAVFERYCKMLCSVYPAKFKPKDCECESP